MLWQVHAIETKGNGIALQFEHPTIAGTTVGGWMNRADKIPIVSAHVPPLHTLTAAATCRQASAELPSTPLLLCCDAPASVAAGQPCSCCRGSAPTCKWAARSRCVLPCHSAESALGQQSALRWC